MPQGVDLLPQFFDLLLHFFPLPLLFAAGLVFEFGQFDAVVFAQPSGEGLAFQADLVGRQVPGVELLLDLAAPRSGPLDLGVQLVALLLQGFALIDEADGLGGEGLLAKIQVGEFRLGPQDVPPRGLGPLDAKFQLLAALVDRAAAFLAGFLELPQPQPQAPQPLLALGQFDLGFRRLAIAGLPLALQAGRPARGSRPGGFPSRTSRFRAAGVFRGLRPAAPRPHRAAPRRPGIRRPGPPAAD